MSRSLKPYNWNENNTKCDTWFERDRAMVTLTDLRDQQIMILLDDDVTHFIECGFKRKNQSWHEALVEYATDRKLITQKYS